MSDALFDEETFVNTYHMISRDGCGYCEKALNLFNILDIPVAIRKVATEEERQWFVREGHRTFPRIFKNGKLVGGYDDLVAILRDTLGNK